MNRKYIISIVLGWLIGCMSVWADDSSETWAAGTVVGDRTFSQDGTVLIYLQGDITLTGTITLNTSKTTVRFLNKSGKELTIYNGGASLRTTPMFKVTNGAKLAFNYYDYKVLDDDNLVNSDLSNLETLYPRIIIDGGAGFSDMVSSSTDGAWVMTPAADGKMFEVSMFQSIGALELYNVLIRNFHGRDEDVNDATDNHAYTGIGVIGLAPTGMFPDGSNLNYRYTKIVRSTIEKCKARSGTAISVGSNSYLNKEQDPNDSDRLITLEEVTIRNCVQYCDNAGWGGVIRFRGGSHHSLVLKNTIFEGNFSHGDGAGLWWNAAGHKDTKCTIDGCTFESNRAMRESGGLRLETTFEFTGGATKVCGNSCFGKKRVKSADGTYTYEADGNYKGNGAGIHIFGYAGTKGTVGGEFIYDLPSTLSVYKNEAAGYGGGIAFDFKSNNLIKETKIISNFNGLKVWHNEAGMGGGGIYFNNTTNPDSLYVFNINLNSGQIYYNEASSGGGIYINKIDVGHEDDADGNIAIYNNKVRSGDGGGIYLSNGSITLNSASIYRNTTKYENSTIGDGGGIYLSNGNITLNSASIYENTTTVNGGGVAIQNGSLIINDVNGSITNNEAGEYGGGIYVYGTSGGERKSVTLSGGTISGNSALYGGGVAAYGFLNLDIEGVSIQHNTAKNGGGVFAAGNSGGNGTIVNYNSGIVRYNKAEAVVSPIETAYNESYEVATGMGGGIYMSQYTHLKVGATQNFGIYGNIAENGADDLFGYNMNVWIDLPNVENLDLVDYNTARVHKLFWGEDYVTNDTYYDKGTNRKTAIDGAWDGTNQRYRDVLNKLVENGKYYTLSFGEGETMKYFTSSEVDNVSTYLCLTLGWSVNNIRLIKEGMKDGENAVFKILKKEADNSYTEYMTVVLTDRDKQSDGTRSKEITLSSDGIWKVEEVNWSWAYTPDVTYIEKTLNAENTDADFRFKNTAKGDVPIHDEAIIVNEMQNGGE